jgi:hypothetical protein
MGDLAARRRRGRLAVAACNGFLTHGLMWRSITEDRKDCMVPGASMMSSFQAFKLPQFLGVCNRLSRRRDKLTHLMML